MAVTIDQIPQAALDMIPGAACVAFTLCTPDGTVVGHGFKIRGGNEGVFIPANALTDPRAGFEGQFITDPRPGFEGQFVTAPIGYSA